MKIRIKLLLVTLVTALVIFSLAMGYIGINFRTTSIEYAQKIVDANAQDAAKGIKAELDYHMGIAQTLKVSALSCYGMRSAERTHYFNEIMENTLRANPEYLAVWISWELAAIDSSWYKPFGRQRSEVYILDGDYKQNIDSVDTEGDVIEGLYYKLKVAKKSAITNPYVYKYPNSNDSILEASYAVPVLKDGEYLGLVGNDIPMTTFINMIDKIKPFDESYAFFISNNGTFVAHPDANVIGKVIDEEYVDFSYKNQIIDKVKKGETFSLTTNDPRTGVESYISFVPINIGQTSEPWAIGISVPRNVILREAIDNLKASILVTGVGLVVLALIVAFFITQITTPVKSVTEILEQMSQGIVDKGKKLKIKSTDEIGEMSKSANMLIDRLNDMAIFAREIGRGNLKAGYKPTGRADRLGHALLDMRENLIDAEIADKQMRAGEAKRMWSQQGVTELGNILRNDYETLEDLSYEIIKFLIKYVEGNQGAMYVIDDINPEKPVIKMEAAYAFDRKKMLEASFAVGEGIVGRAVKEHETVYMTNVPDGYTYITSGLGEETPRCILVVPLIFNEEVYGAFEIASFKELEKYQLEFMEASAERIASTVSNTRKTVSTKSLLEQSQKQSQELTAKEEQMRKTVMEMQQAQEKATLKEQETENILDAISSVASIVYYKPDGVILDIKDTKMNLFGLTKQDFIGKKQIELNQDFKDNPKKYEEFWNALRDGKVQKRLFVYEKGDQKIWIDETYTPLYDINKQIYQILNIGIDVTELMKLKYENDKK